MDRRRRKTRNAIFNSFIDLLEKKEFNQITVDEIINNADIARATFYAHFETKDFLLKQMCEELFCHICDTINNQKEHHHIFECESSDSVFLHLIYHLQNNDNNILKLISCKNNDLFLRYFKENLKTLVACQLNNFKKKDSCLPDSFLINHISSSFVESLKWWIDNGKKETPEMLVDYFLLAVS